MGNATDFFDDRPRFLLDEDILGFPLSITSLTIRGLQGFIAIVVNMATILAVYKYEFLWEECTSRFVLSLAFADLFGGVTAFFEISRTALEMAGTKLILLCYVELFLNLVSGVGNFFNILFVTIDRHIYITRPLRYRSIVTPFRTSMAIIILWCLIICQITLIVVFPISSMIEKKCTLYPALPFIMPQVFIVTALVVPCYVHIMLTVHKLTKAEPHLSCYPQDLQAQQKENLKQRNMAKTMAYVLTPFLFCYYFTTMYNIVFGTLYKPPFSFGIVVGKKISMIIFWLQNLINPFIYGWKNQHFRKAYRKLFEGSKVFVFRFSGRMKNNS